MGWPGDAAPSVHQVTETTVGGMTITPDLLYRLSARAVIVAFALINFWLTSRIASSGGAKPKKTRKKGGTR